VRSLLARLTTLAGAVGLIGLLAGHSGISQLRAATAGERTVLARSASRHSSPSCVPPRPDISAALAGGRVTVSPAPLSRDASAQTQISFLGPAAEQLGGVSVTASRTGAHGGRLLAYSQGDGVSFLPAKPFAEGERVTVRATVSGGARPTPLEWSFTVAVRDRAGAAGGSSPRAPKPTDY
jgi:hypothetical protein